MVKPAFAWSDSKALRSQQWWFQVRYQSSHLRNVTHLIYVLCRLKRFSPITQNPYYSMTRVNYSWWCSLPRLPPNPFFLNLVYWVSNYKDVKGRKCHRTLVFAPKTLEWLCTMIWKRDLFRLLAVQFLAFHLLSRLLFLWWCRSSLKSL